MNTQFIDRCSNGENTSEKSDANVKAALMQLKEEQILGGVQDQLNHKASPHGIMDDLSAAHTFSTFRDEFFLPLCIFFHKTCLHDYRKSSLEELRIHLTF